MQKTLLCRLLCLMVLLCGGWRMQGASHPAVNRTDAQIEGDFRTRLNRSKLSTDGIQIRVKSGVATLTGRTTVIQHKGSATRMAKSAGAHQVVNQIEISAAARQAAAAKMAANLHRNAAPVSAMSGAGATKTSAGSSPVSAANTVSAAPSGPAPPPVRRAQIKH